jgi:uncharacterized damage-inducible protein DinB
VAEDSRVARNSEEPHKTGAAGAGRWSDYLDWVRAEIIEGVLGLTPEEQRTTRVASGWTPIELLSHVLHMEQRWFVWGFLGEQVDDPWGDGRDDRWYVPDDVTVDDLVAMLLRVGQRTSALLDEHPLTETGRPGGRFEAEPPTLAWICFHVLQEYARHAGHLDVVVELAGGEVGE